MKSMKSNSSKVLHMGMEHSLEEWQNTKLKWSKPETLIIKERLDGLSYSQTTNEEKIVALDDIIFSCSAIYGCPLPTTVEYAEKVSAMLDCLIFEMDYNNFTMGEIILAMKLNAYGVLCFDDTIAFTGNTINVFFMAKLLKKYSSRRNIIDGKIRNYLDEHPQTEDKK